MRGRIAKKQRLTLGKATVHKLALKPGEFAIVTVPEDSYQDPAQLCDTLGAILPPEMARRVMVWYGDLKLSIVSMQ